MPGDMVLVEKFEHPRVEGSDEGEILAILEEKNDLPSFSTVYHRKVQKQRTVFNLPA